MRDTVATKIYAQGFAGLIKNTIGYEKGIEELFRLRQIITDHSELMEFFNNPEIIRHEKYHLIDKVFASDFSIEVVHFLKLLLEKKRFENVVDIIDYVRMLYLRSQRINVLVKTVIPLDVDMLEIIKKKLEKRFAANVALYIGIDPDLIGGVELVIGNTVINGSVKKRINELKEKLMTVRVD